MIQPSDANNKKDYAYHAIKELLITQEIEPGTVLIEKDLCEMLNVSRTPIRSALSDLAKENLVEIYPGRSVIAATIRIEDIIDIYDIRELLDPFAFELFLRKYGFEAAEDKLESFVNKMEVAIKNKDFKAYIEEDKNFHQTYMQNTGNQQLGKVLFVLNDQIVRFMHSFSNEIWHSETLWDHKVILNYIREHNMEEAKAQIGHHLNKAKQYYIERLIRIK